MIDKPETIFAGFGDLAELGPVITHEVTDYGWRGLTMDGEVLEVKSANGHKINVPDEITVTFRGKAIGVRPINKPPKRIDIGEYVDWFNSAIEDYRHGNLSMALLHADAAIALAPTLRARFNRAMILLAMGRWREGLPEYDDLEQYAPFIRPPVREALAAGLKIWRGEELAGKRLLVIHAHGFGDTLQCLRYVPRLRVMGAKVSMRLPDELARLVQPYGSFFDPECDYFVPFLHLLTRLQVEPDAEPDLPYLEVDPCLLEKWRAHLGPAPRKRIGIAWSVGKPSNGDYPRAILPEQLVQAIDGELHSVQIQAGELARALGIQPHGFEDFADCAALMLCMDEIVTVDTAAVHLAGAIGHPNVKLLLSKWASWRWVKNWYPNVTICRQISDGNWASALAQC